MTIFSRSAAAGLPAAIVAVAVYVLFVDKAFNIDDLTFLVMAQHMLTDPLHPAAAEMVFHGNPLARISGGVWSGPVMPAMLVPAVAAGGAEWLAHLVMLGVFLIGIFSCSALALRLGVSAAGAAWVALLAATSPAVLASATTNMPDVPAMSFAALAAERMLAFRQDHSLWSAIGAAVALALGVLSRQHVAVLFACFLPLLLSRWPSSFRELRAEVLDRSFLSTLVPMMGAVALLAVTYIAMRDPQSGETLARVPVSAVQLWVARVNLANVPAQWVLSFPLGLAWSMLHARRMLASPWCWGGAIAGAGLAALSQTVYRQWDWLPWQAPVTALGMAVLVDIVVDAWRRRDAVEIGLAAWLLIAWPAAVYPHLPPKYLVPSVPAMALLIVRHAEQFVSRRHALGILGFSVVSGLVLGILIARADDALAEVGRKGGQVVAEEVRRGERVWFDGAWGFQWYALQAGGRAMTTGLAQPAPGDIVVVGLQGSQVNRLPNKRLERRIIFDAPGGRVLEKPAGFFSNGWGPLPWRWSSKPLEPIEVWRIE